MKKYFLKSPWQEEATEVTKEQYVQAEQNAGFRSKFGEDEPATQAFGGANVEGWIEKD